MAADLESIDYHQAPEGEVGSPQRIITWSIVPDGTTITGGNSPASSNLLATLDRIFGSREAWTPTLEAALQAWDDISGIHFVRETRDDGAPLPNSPADPGVRGELRFAGTRVDGPDNVLGYATSTSDVVLDTEFHSSAEFLSYVQYVLTHELGHVLGLKHVFPSDNRKLMENTFTFNPETTSINPRFDDVREVQRLHGDNLEPNDSTSQAMNLGSLPVGTSKFDTLSIHQQTDVDFYRFDGSTGQQISIRVIPVGEKYKRGDDASSVAELDALRQSKLQVTLLDAQQNVLGFADSDALGAMAAIQRTELPGNGQYFVRVDGSSNSTQMYQLVLIVGLQDAVNPAKVAGDFNLLKEMIDAANAKTTPTEIRLPPGTYRFEHELQVNSHVTIIGAGVSETILDGRDSVRLFSLYSDDPGSLKLSLSLRNLTLTRGRSDRAGGAVGSYKADLDFENVVLSDNHAIEDGGAVSIFEAKLRMHKVVAIYNSSETKGGGAVFAHNSTVRITDSRFDGNSASYGGGIYIVAGILVETTIERTQIVRNRGGGISTGTLFDGVFSLSDSWVIGNTNDYGAGLSLGRGTNRLTRVHIEGNVAQFRGGGIRVADQGVLILEDSLVANNRARSEAGIEVGNSPSESVVRRSWIRGNRASYISGGIGTTGRLRIEQSTISENVAEDWFGGGIGAYDAGAVLLENSTVSFNRAQSDGAGLAGPFFNVINSTITRNRTVSKVPNQGAGLHIFPNGRALLSNALIADNASEAVTDVFGDLEVSHSLLGAVDEETAKRHRQNGNIIGVASNPVDPKLGPLAANGGPTPTHRLIDNGVNDRSPAIDAGMVIGQIKIDQRGNARSDGQPDIGAFEVSDSGTFVNRPPTIDQVITPAPVALGTGLQTLDVTGITDGGDSQTVVVSVRSSNPAVLSQLNISDVRNQTAELSYVPRAAGETAITITVTDAGGDKSYGTSDDLSTAMRFTVVVTSGQIELPIIVIEDALILEPRIGIALMNFSVALSRPASSPVSVRARTLQNSASEGIDYTSIDSIVTFNPGEVFKQVSVPILSDSLFEKTEQFAVQLSEVQGAALARDQAIGLIFDAPIVLGSPILPEVIDEPDVIPFLFVSIHSIGPAIIPPPGTDLPEPEVEVSELLARSFRFSDVDRNGFTTPLDALIVINYINRNSIIPNTFRTTIDVVDVNRDGHVTPLDALLIINELNRAVVSGEGEATGVQSTHSIAVDQRSFAQPVFPFDSTLDLEKLRRRM